MSKSYRVYEERGRKTYFKKDGCGWWCTHGSWFGKHKDIDGDPCLQNGRGKEGLIVFESFRDLTEEQYKSEYK
jgi:hypothetical protein